jgi:hypothetical protein
MENESVDFRVGRLLFGFVRTDEAAAGSIPVIPGR